MKLLLAHLLALSLLAGLAVSSIGAMRRSWPRILVGAAVVGVAAGVGNWIFL